jgi:hypothetical protein
VLHRFYEDDHVHVHVNVHDYGLARAQNLIILVSMDTMLSTGWLPSPRVTGTYVPH